MCKLIDKAILLFCKSTMCASSAIITRTVFTVKIVITIGCFKKKEKVCDRKISRNRFENLKIFERLLQEVCKKYKI